MVFQMRRGIPLAVLLALVLSLGVAFAAFAAAPLETLSWGLTYNGPPDRVDWPNEDIPVAGAFNAVSFADPAHGWAVGVTVDNVSSSGGTKSALIAFTGDGGSNWSLQSSGSVRELHGVVARLEGDAWAVGDSGTLLHYTGAWAPVPVTGWPSTKALRAIAFSKTDPSIGWAVGDGYGVALTTDGGAHWTTKVAPGTYGTLRSISAAGAGAYAVGDSATGSGSAIMKYLDATGVSTAKSVGGGALFGIAFADAGNGWAVGAARTFVRTKNGGLTWSAQAGEPLNPAGPSADGLRAIAFADAANGIAVGKYQGVWRTTDGGAHWLAEQMQIEASSNDHELRGAAFVPGSADHPVTVGRSLVTSLTNKDQKARAYRGTWVRPDLTAPTTTSDAREEYLGPATIHLTATDNLLGSGVAQTYYRLDGGAQTPGTTVQVSTAGPHTLEFWSEDSADPKNTEARNTVTFTITLPDTAAPVTTSDAKPTYEDSATIRFTPADVGSGVAHTYYRLDGDAQLEGQSVAVSGEGGHTLEFWSVDVAGNAETPHKTADFAITIPDRIPPVTTSDAGAQVYPAAAAIRLTAADAGSGVAHTYYKLDAGVQTPGTIVQVSTAGSHTLEFWSVDVAGNVEPVKTVIVRIATPPPPPDTTAPVTTSDAVSAYLDSAIIRLAATDAGGSGVAQTYYKLDGGAQTPGTTVQVSTAGSHTLEFWSVDVAGIVETHKTRSFTITVPDRVAPVTGSDALTAYTSLATIRFTPTDSGGSGVAQTYYKLDGGAQTPGTTVQVSTAGPHTLEFWSVDIAHNQEAHKTATFLISGPLDTTAPTTVWQGYASSYATKANIVLVATDNVGGSGVARTFYKLDGAAQVEGSSLAVTAGGAHTLEYWSEDAASPTNAEAHQSATFTVVLPQATLYTPRAPSSARHGRSFTVYGYLTRHTYSQPVKLSFYRYKSGRYVYYKSLKPKVYNSTYGGRSVSKYKFTTSLPYAGKWRIRATHEDAGHRASYSAYEYVRIY